MQSVSPPVRYWLAYRGGRSEALTELSAWTSSRHAIGLRPVLARIWGGRSEGLNFRVATGYLDYLFTHPDYRHRGLATALVHHCVADSRKRGAGPVALEADPAGTPKHMYAAMGFRPLSVSHEYLKTFE